MSENAQNVKDSRNPFQDATIYLISAVRSQALVENNIFYQINESNRRNLIAFYQQKKGQKSSPKKQTIQQETIVIHLKVYNNGFENDFTRYVPIQRHISTEEMAKRNFPVMAENQELYTRFTDLLLTQKWNISNKLTQWNEVKSRFILFLDLEFLLVIRLIGIMFGFSKQILDQIKRFFQLKCDDYVILFSIQNINLYKDQYNIKIIPNMPFSIFESEEINETSLQINDKIFFCSKCMMYHCFRHEPLTIQEATYQNPYVNYEIKVRTASRIIQYYNFLLYGVDESSIPKLQRNQCSLKCYKNLGIEKYEQIKKKKIPIECQFTQALIKIVKIYNKSFGYDICSIAQRLAKKYTCQLLFVYLIEQICLQRKFVEQYLFENPIIKKKIKPKPAHLSHQISIPCKHHFTDQNQIYAEDCSDCKCGQIWKFCDKYCLCNPQLCKIKRIGCSCNSNCKDEDCICWINGAECDPDLCVGCFRQNVKGLSMMAKKNRDIYCRNNEILFKQQSKTVIGNSKICKGYGLFLVEPVDKYDMIIQYIGEVINDMEQEARAILDKQDPFFAFEIVEKEKLIDAKYFGNKARFINHSKLKCNCEVKNIYSQGNIYIGIFALSELMPGTELLMDYDGNEDLGKKHRWINQGLPEESIQKQKKVKKNPDL